MKTSILIAATFLTVIILQLLPYKETFGDTIVIYSYGILPPLFTFLIIRLLVLVLVSLFTYFKLKKILSGQIVIKRKDLNLKKTYTSIAFWFVFVLVLQLLERNSMPGLNGTSNYFYIILSSFLIYAFYKKLLIRYNKPDFLSITPELIYLKGFFSNGKRKVNNLESINYDTKQNAVILQFREGLDDIYLFLTDYEINDINSLINYIEHEKDGEILFENSFKKYFPLNQ